MNKYPLIPLKIYLLFIFLFISSPVQAQEQQLTVQWCISGQLDSANPDEFEICGDGPVDTTQSLSFEGAHVSGEERANITATVKTTIEGFFVKAEYEVNVQGAINGEVLAELEGSVNFSASFEGLCVDEPEPACYVGDFTGQVAVAGYQATDEHDGDQYDLEAEGNTATVRSECPDGAGNEQCQGTSFSHTETGSDFFLLSADYSFYRSRVQLDRPPVAMDVTMTGVAQGTFYEEEPDCEEGAGKQNNDECECQINTFEWTDAGWSQEGVPGQSDLVRYKATATVENVPSAFDALEVSGANVVFDLQNTVMVIEGDTPCQPALWLNGNGELDLRGNTEFVIKKNVFIEDASTLLLQEESSLVANRVNLHGVLDHRGENIFTDTLVIDGDGASGIIGSSQYNAAAQVIPNSPNVPVLLRMGERQQAEVKLIVRNGMISNGSSEVPDGVFLPSSIALSQAPQNLVEIGVHGTAALQVEGGAHFSGALLDNTSTTLLGVEAEGSGQLEVLGRGLPDPSDTLGRGSFYNTGTLLVGYRGEGNLVVDDYGRIEARDLMIVGGDGGKGFAYAGYPGPYLHGPNIKTPELIVGSGGRGELLATLGALIHTYRLEIGRADSGFVNLNDGAIVYLDTMRVKMGVEPDGVGSLRISGPVLSARARAQLITIIGTADIGVAGKGTVRIDEGAMMVLAFRSTVRLGVEESGDGALIASGHTFAPVNEGESELSRFPSLISTDTLVVGHRGRGDLQLMEGAEGRFKTLWISRGATSFGSAFVSGDSTKLETEELYIGTGAFGLMQVEAEATVRADVILMGEHGQIQGNVISIGTLPVGKRAATGIFTESLVVHEGATLEVDSLVFGEHATLGGTWSYPSPLFNAGTLDPGDASGTGVFTATAGFEQSTTGALKIDLGPGGADQLAVAGNAALDGLLRFGLLDGYIPAAGASYEILTASSISGGFTAIESVPGLAMTLQYETDRVVATVDAVTVDVDKEIADGPTAFALDQNYPNPFNSITIIGYEVAEPSLMQLTVFDVLGREVHRLVDDFQPVGRYEVTFDTGNLPSGIYFYKLTAGARNSLHIRQMVLMR